MIYLIYIGNFWSSSMENAKTPITDGFIILSKNIFRGKAKGVLYIYNNSEYEKTSKTENTLDVMNYNFNVDHFWKQPVECVVIL